MAAPIGPRGPAGPPSAADAFFGRRSDQVDAWLAIEADGRVTAFSGKVELGTGVSTALAQIVAEELDVPAAQVRLVMGDTARTPPNGSAATPTTARRASNRARPICRWGSSIPNTPTATCLASPSWCRRSSSIPNDCSSC